MTRSTGGPVDETPDMAACKWSFHRGHDAVTHMLARRVI